MEANEFFDYKEAFKNLQSNVSFDEIEWRQQGRPNAKGNIQIIPYINNRAVQKRLDECVSPENWKCAFERWGDKGVKCQLSIRIAEEWITKEDCAEDTDIESIKGGVSDAMKRAAVQWGIGRNLYDFPKIYCVAADPQRGGIPDWAFKKLKELTTEINNGTMDRDYVVLKA